MSAYRSAWKGMRVWTGVRAVSRGKTGRWLVRRSIYRTTGRAVRRVIR